MSTLKVSRKSQRGAAALEFALVVPVLILLVFGIVDFGNVMSVRSVVANAAREGARAASLGFTEAATKTTVNSALSSIAGANTVTVKCISATGATCSLDDSTSDTGGTVVITVKHVHTWLSPAVIGLGSTISITQTSQMRIE